MPNKSSTKGRCELHNPYGGGPAGTYPGIAASEKGAPVSVAEFVRIPTNRPLRGQLLTRDRYGRVRNPGIDLLAAAPKVSDYPLRWYANC